MGEDNLDDNTLQKMDKLEIYKRLTYHYRELSYALSPIDPDVEEVKSIERYIIYLEKLTESDDFYKYCKDCRGVELHRIVTDPELLDSECISCKEDDAPLIEVEID